jgi:hypothetical protein
MLENLAIIPEEYEEFLNLINEGGALIESLLTPDNEQLPNN